MSCCPRKECHPFRNLNFPNALPRESRRSCISNLMIKRPNIKLPTSIKTPTKPITLFPYTTLFRSFNDWELAASYSLLHFIQTRIPRGGGCNRLCWDLNGSGKFDIRFFYHKIRNAVPSTFPWKGIWKVKVPKRVAFFMWTAAHGQILTLDNLMLRGLPLANCCCMCCCNAESVNHL